MKMSADAVQHADVRTDGAEVVFTTAKTFLLGLNDAAVARSAAALLGRPVKVRVEIGTQTGRLPAAPPPVPRGRKRRCLLTIT